MPRPRANGIGWGEWSRRVVSSLGNLVHDEREGIENITWTVAGKVKQVSRPVPNTSGLKDLTFGYGTHGHRIMKQVSDPTTDAEGYREHYVHDAQGNVMAIYRSTQLTTEGPELSFQLKERPIYGSSRLGSDHLAVELAGNPTYDPNTAPNDGGRRYELTDHLGNVMAVVSEQLLSVDIDGDLSTDATVAEVLAWQDYEPFGSLLPGRNYSSDAYRFGFQGQEKDDEIYGATGTNYAFEYRMHDPRVGRFWSLDPLASKYPHNSPYAFSENRVIDSNELEGLESIPGGQIVTSDDLLAPALLTTATDATVTPLTLWDTQVRYPEGGPAAKTGLLTEGVIGGIVLTESIVRKGASGFLLLGSAVVAGGETFVRNVRADIANDFSEYRQYPGENYTAPYTLGENWLPVRRESLTEERLSPSEGAEIVGAGMGAIGLGYTGFLPTTGSVVVDKALQMGVKGGVSAGVTTGMRALVDEAPVVEPVAPAQP